MGGKFDCFFVFFRRRTILGSRCEISISTCLFPYLFKGFTGKYRTRLVAMRELFSPRCQHGSDIFEKSIMFLSLFIHFLLLLFRTFSFLFSLVSLVSCSYQNETHREMNNKFDKYKRVYKIDQNSLCMIFFLFFVCFRLVSQHFV